MKKRRFRIPKTCGLVATAVVVLVLLSLPIVAWAEDDDKESPAKESSPLMDKVLELYEKAKRSGENVPDDITEWLKEDFAKFGDWEYRIIRTNPPQNSSGDEALEALLNELGQERWNCFWVERKNGEMTFFMKRPSKSYLKSIPMMDLLKLIPQQE